MKWWNKINIYIYYSEYLSMGVKDSLVAQKSLNIPLKELARSDCFRFFFKLSEMLVSEKSSYFSHYPWWILQLKMHRLDDIKGAWHDPQHHPPKCFQTHSDFVIFFWLLWWNLVWVFKYLRRNQRKCCLENVVTKLNKTINNVSAIFSYFQFSFFFHCGRDI